MTRDEVLAIIKQAEEDGWEELDLSGQGLKDLPEEIGRLNRLINLDLYNNNFDSLPEGLAKLINIQHLDISKNYLAILPDWLSKLTDLQTLNVGDNKLASMPVGLSSLSRLQTLNISSNTLDSLSQEITKLVSLQFLYLTGNKLKFLPKGLAQLANLQTLDISANGFKKLPAELFELKNLQILDISRNNLRFLPEELIQLQNLQTLDISGNNFGTLPKNLAQLTNLQQLYVYDNPITEPSPEIFGKALSSNIPADLKAIRRYNLQLDEVGEKIFYEAKLLIIGEGGAGKTSLALKLQNPMYELENNLDSTIGIDVFNWYFKLPPGFDQEKYRVNIWDFGGQAIYFATHQFFLTSRSIYILVTDTRRQPANFYDWLRMQEVFGGTSPVFLLKNHNRKVGDRFNIDNLPEIQRQFKNLKEIFELDLNDVPEAVDWQFLTDKLKNYLLKLEHVGKPRPETWVKVRQILSKEEQDTISRRQFLDLCQDQGIKEEADALQLSDYLHHLGDLLHFQDDFYLKDLVILKPTWGLDAVYRILNDKDILNNWGQFTFQDLDRLWHQPHYTGHHPHLLRLMQKFQLCYPLPNDSSSFIAPQLLGSDVPEYSWDHLDNLQLRYKYSTFMPRGVLSRAIVKLHYLIKEQRLVWNSGVILTSEFAKAEILELRGKNEISIRISGQGPFKLELLMEIVRVLDELHQGFPKLHYDKYIPCNCSACSSMTDPYFYPLDKLRNHLAHGKRTIECGNAPFEDVNIDNLLDIGFIAYQPGTSQDLARFVIYGDYVKGDKIDGDKLKVGNINEAEGIAIGRSAHSSTTKSQ